LSGESAPGKRQLSLTYQQVSHCAGVFAVWVKNSRSSHQGQMTPMNVEIEEAHCGLRRQMCIQSSQETLRKTHDWPVARAARGQG
ncbi:MAG: hypothetical protein KBA85_20400, partial [Chloroflexi bacterium]|nr:hypothetical protein [Chloroflexota bacterium]